MAGVASARDDVGSSSLLVAGVEWVRHDGVRDFFREQARWSVGDVMQTGKEQLEKGLNRASPLM
ncbi:MAG: hypothetical protein H0X69_05780 [Gemmatimonadales bacterium]|nr:hypothetical protein [Gemmatimonadales bacterium]